MVQTERDGVLEDETSRSESTHSATGEGPSTSTNSSVDNDATRLKPKGLLVAEVHKNERIV